MIINKQGERGSGSTNRNLHRVRTWSYSVLPGPFKVYHKFEWSSSLKVIGVKAEYGKTIGKKVLALIYMGKTFLNFVLFE